MKGVTEKQGGPAWSSESTSSGTCSSRTSPGGGGSGGRRGQLPQSCPTPPQGDPQAMASSESSVGPAPGRQAGRSEHTSL